jgi:hypothetical protein
MKTVIIHPSRGRAYKALDTAFKWALASPYSVDEYHLSLDNDDTELNIYEKLFIGFATIHINDNLNIVQAANAPVEDIIKEGGHGLFVLVSDDFEPIPNWNEELIKVIPDITKPYIVHVHDGNRDDIITLPIMTLEALRQMGFVYEPSFIHHFCDDYMTWLAKKNGWYIDARHLTFEHKHVAYGKAEMDETYKRGGMNQKAYDIGKKVFEKLTKN